MGWVTPKTNWNGSSSGGIYIGDYFTCIDFNRIKNNLQYLHDYAILQGFPPFDIEFLGNDRTYNDFIYADEINTIEANFNAINRNTINGDYGESPTYYPNGPFITFQELNRLESATLEIRMILENASERKRMFTWNFGKGLGL